MDRIAGRVQEVRDQDFREYADPAKKEYAAVPFKDGDKVLVNHTLAIASLGGATMDNEWNYVQAKLMRALGVVFIENQARI
jgi:formate dehydrogenase major subunit